MIGRFGSAAAEVKEQLLPRVQFPISARVALAIAIALPPPQLARPNVDLAVRAQFCCT